MRVAKRLAGLRPYPFVGLERQLRELRAQGVDVISLGVGNPDMAPAPSVIDAAVRSIREPDRHGYPPAAGTRELREGIARWMDRRFGIGPWDPQREILVTIGSKEAIHNTTMAFVDPCDTVLVPDPAYPTYAASAWLAGGEPFPMPLAAGRGFLPALEDIPSEVARRSKLLWLNYPNNPTGATASRAFLQEVSRFCRDFDILLCHDHAYSEVTFDGYRSPSVLEVPGARDTALEFFSFSKAYNMAGWRVGFVAGSGDALDALARMKSNIDSGVFEAIQRAGLAGLETSTDEQGIMLSEYRHRRDTAVAGLRELGCRIAAPQATPYVWAPVPSGTPSDAFVTDLLKKCGVLTSPGSAYGIAGEGYFRIALMETGARIAEAFRRMKGAGIKWSK